MNQRASSPAPTIVGVSAEGLILDHGDRHELASWQEIEDIAVGTMTGPAGAAIFVMAIEQAGQRVVMCHEQQPIWQAFIEGFADYLPNTIPFEVWGPALVGAADARTQLRFMEFFAANIRNPNTRKAYARATAAFLAWCTAHDVQSTSEVMPLHVASYIEELGQRISVPTVKQSLAAIRHLFDWLVVGQIVPVNPAGSVRGPSHSVRRGKTPVLAPEEARTPST